MLYRPLGRTGISVSVVGIGTWQFGGEWGARFSKRQVRRILAAGRDRGLNLIDTAECYGDHRSEELIGKALRGQRDHWVLATKFGHRFHGFLERSPDHSAAGMRVQLEASLRALETDYVDLYQVHGVSKETAENDELWDALAELKRSGLVRAIGVSMGHDLWALEREAIDSAQVLYNRLETGAEEEILGECRRREIGVLARVPLASGFLSGKYAAGQRFKKKDVRSRIEGEDIDEKLEAARRIQREEVPAGVDMATWALSWCLRDPVVTAVIPGCKSVEQLLSNARAADLLE